MFAIRVEYLTRRVAATAFNDRRVVEWPPHPARLFSAVVATGIDGDDEADALRWIEAQHPPALAVAGHAPRDAVKHYVPNAPTGVMLDARRIVVEAEEALKIAEVVSRALPNTSKSERATAQRAVKEARKKLQSATKSASSPGTPDEAKEVVSRGRQDRFFPSAWLEDPVVHFIWEATPNDTARAALSRVLSRVSYLGHSSSLVHCSLVSEAPGANLVPTERGSLRLRVTQRGQLAALEAAFAQHEGVEPRQLPCVWQPYEWTDAMTTTEIRGSVFDPRWMVLQRVGGPRLPITRAVDLAATIRAAFIKFAGPDQPEAFSGHRVDGKPSQHPHMAVIPLPYVGFEHADGSIMGVAVIMPREGADSARSTVARAFGAWARASGLSDDESVVKVHLGASGELELADVRGMGRLPTSIEERTWIGPSRVWRSATPIALDRNPGDLTSNRPEVAEAAWSSAAEIIARACADIGLPTPRRVEVLSSVSIRGTRKARDFPAFPPQEGRVRRVKVHASIEFDEPVEGPVLIGAGRYLGLGLMRPMREGVRS